MTKIIAVANQKGGVGKTTTTLCLSSAFANQGKNVLMIDSDPQSSLTIAAGFKKPDELENTLAEAIALTVEGKDLIPSDFIRRVDEHLFILPANIILSGVETRLINAMSRETILRQIIHQVKENFDYVLIDCMPSLGILTINTLTACQSVIIPVNPEHLAVKGLELFLDTITRVKKQLNPSLFIEGLLLTKVDRRTNFAKEQIAELEETYSQKGIRIFKTEIPSAIKVVEAAREGISPITRNPSGKVSIAYASFAQEVDTTLYQVGTKFMKEEKTHEIRKSR